jgi:U4/U6.U5 tri-snRNP-associated protein 1
MASGDTPLGLNASFQARQERTGSATMVLSVGNRGSAPMLEGDIGPNLRANPGPSTSKKGGEGGKKGKGRATEDVNLTPMLSAPMPMAAADEAAFAPVPRQTAGFQPINRKAREASEAVVDDSPASTPRASTPAAAIKIQIGKRKAEGEGEGSPASKRRS